METGEIAVTHGGKFHADDVFAAALLRMIHPGIQIRRVMEVPEGFTGLAFDIGGGAFDHHQQGAEERENGVPYAAFGLLWRAYGEELLGKEGAARFDAEFVQPLDKDDNTGCGNALADAVSAFNPPWDSSLEPDACFEEAVAVASSILAHRLERIRGVQRAANLVLEALAGAEHRVVVLPRHAPWKEFLIPSNAEFVVYPSPRGGFNAQGVPARFGSPVLKCAFPRKWAGLPAKELAEESGIASLTFCHRNGFLVSARTQEGALQACHAAQKATNNEKPPQ